MTGLRVEMLPAGSGDALWVTYGDAADRHVVVDCGFANVAPGIADRIRSAGRVELLVITHIDRDHIGGAIPLLDDPDVTARIGDVWFNGRKQVRTDLSYRQGDEVSLRLDRHDRPFLWNRESHGTKPPPAIGTDLPAVDLDGGLRLTVLSPTAAQLEVLGEEWPTVEREFGPPPDDMLGRRLPPRKVPPESLDLTTLAGEDLGPDTSVTNGSSIAVLAEYRDRAVLLTGDAHAGVLAASIRKLQADRDRAGERLRLDALKVSHHGSANATTRELLDLIDCPRYLISTDGSGHYHPDRAAIARIVLWGGPSPALYFNYRTGLNDLWADPGLQERHAYTAVYPPTGQAVEL